MQETLTSENGVGRPAAVEMLTTLTGSPGIAESMVSAAESEWDSWAQYMDLTIRVTYLASGRYVITESRPLRSHLADRYQ